MDELKELREGMTVGDINGVRVYYTIGDEKEVQRQAELARLGAAVEAKAREYSREHSLIDEDNIDKLMFHDQQFAGEVLALAFDSQS